VLSADVSVASSFLDGVIDDVDVASSFSRATLIDHVDSRFIVNM